MPPLHAVYFAILITLLCQAGSAQVVVNEIMASNAATLADAQGEFDDWVEIHNPGGSDVDLRGYFVSDDAEDAGKWMLAGEVPLLVPAGGYALLWLDNDEADGADHLPFRLAADGDFFILTAPDGATVIEQIELPVQHPDISYGRSQDHGGQFRYLIHPTPSAVNDPLGVAVLEGITFSHEPGSFVNAFDLTLATTSVGATIRYTLDGSVPTGTTGQLYSVPIGITQTTCIRAALFLGAARISPVQSQQFLALDATLAAFDSNLPVVLIHSHGYDFSNDSVASTDYPAQPVCAVFFETGTEGRAAVADVAQFVGRAGMNVRGASSKAWPKKQFKFETWDEEDGDRNVPLLGMPADSDWILNASYFDKSLMRNELVYHWWAQLGYYSPRTRFVEVFINPDPAQPFSMAHYQGIYVLMEEIKRGSARMDVARLDAADVAEPAITGGYIAQATNLNQDWVSGEGTRYRYVEPSASDPLALQKTWLRDYVEAAEDSVYAANFTDPVNGYAKYLDVPSQIDYDIMRELSRNADGASTFFSIDRGGKLKMGPLWDYDQALGLSSLGTTALGNSYDTFGWNGYYMRSSHWLAWWNKLDDDPLYQRAWNDRWVRLREGTLTTANLLAKIDANAALLSEAVVRNFEKWDILGQVVWAPNGISRADPGETSRDTYAKEATYLRDWVEARVQWIDSQVPAPPDFAQNGGAVPTGFSLTMSPGSSFGSFPGEVFYTLDGTDPAAGGVLYSAPLSLNASVRILARTKSAGGSWGSLRDATFIVGTQPPSSAALTISEIHYNPDGPDDLEFIEIANRGASPINLTGVRLSTAVEFDFAAAELMPGDAVLVVEDVGPFAAAFPGVSVAGQWTGQLNNAGETIELLDPTGAVIHSVSYGQDGAWPGEADGKGFTLQQRELSSDPALPASWRLSTFENGTPGSVPSPNALTAEAWRVLNFSAAELTQSQISDLSSDPDRDGFSNLLEFAFAKQPLTAEANPPFQIEIEMIGGAPYLTLTFERPANSTLQYVLQKSTDLSDWRTRPLIRVRSSLNPATQIETLTVREKQPMQQSSPNGGAQMRIRIAQ